MKKIIIMTANTWAYCASDGYGSNALTTTKFLYQFSNCQNSILNIWLLEWLPSSFCLRNMNTRKILWKLHAPVSGTGLEGQKMPKLVLQSLVNWGSGACERVLGNSKIMAHRPYKRNGKLLILIKFGFLISEGIGGGGGEEENGKFS